MTVGRNVSTITQAWQKPIARFAKNRASAIDGRPPGKPDARTKRIGIPSRGTMVASARPRTPTNSTRVLAPATARPMARAGFT